MRFDVAVLLFLSVIPAVIARRQTPLWEDIVMPATEVVRNPFDTSNYGKLQLNNGLALSPQMGWNSWNFFACNINEAVIKETADALVSTGLADLGYNYVNIDDCWSSLLRNAEGELVPDPKTFPSGIKALADYIHGKGLKIGLLHAKSGLDPSSMKKMMRIFLHLGALTI